MSERVKKANKFLKQEISKAFQKEIVCDSMITVKDVETTRDLKSAVVWVSILGGDENKTLRIIEKNKVLIQKIISSKMTSKYAPKLTYKVDHSGEYVEKIDKLLREKNL